jgi:uncharacterized membrane protein YagU involved in acid resistance
MPTADARRIALAATTVGVLDGLFAIVYFDFILHIGGVARIFQGIARAVLGDAALTGGIATAALGLVLHFSVAFAWTIAYYGLLRAFPALARATRSTANALVAGVILGAIVWTTMDTVILPFTRQVPRPPITSTFFLVELIGHMLIVGPPIAVIVRRSPPSAAV